MRISRLTRARREAWPETGLVTTVRPFSWGRLGKPLPPAPAVAGLTYSQAIIQSTPLSRKLRRQKMPDWLRYLTWFVCTAILIGAAILCWELWPRG